MVVSSDLARARATAQAIAAFCQCPLVFDPALRERSFGSFQGMTHLEVAEQWPEQSARWKSRDPDFSPGDGESLRIFYGRCIDATLRIAEEHAGRTVVLVAHGGVMDCLYRAASRIPLDAQRVWSLDNAAINRLLHTSSGLTLVGWNDTSHLDRSSARRDRLTRHRGRRPTQQRVKCRTPRSSCWRRRSSFCSSPSRPFVGWRRKQITYAWADTLNSIGLGMMSQVVGIFTKLFTLGIYQWVYAHTALFELSASSAWVWIGSLLAYDFLYYWLHRAGHRVALFWAAHVVHHQSEEYNLSTALRQTGSGWLAGWLFYLPLAIAGVPPLVFAVVALIDLLYQFWVHTRQIDRLGWFDRWFCAPSNHRVHHAVNDVYLDRNYGGILVVWDRLFGSFQPELDDPPCVYGTRSPLQSWNPVWANVEVYAALVHDTRHARRWSDKLRLWLKPPGWRPAELEQRFPKQPFELFAIPRYAPAMTARRTSALPACCSFSRSG